MKKRRLYAIAAINLLILVVAIFAAYNYVSNSHQQSGSATTNSFFQEPIVDLIIPALYSNGVNAPLNLTRGSNTSLAVEVFPTVNVDATIGAKILSLSSPTENVSNTISTSIDPTTLTISKGSSANATLTIASSAITPVGEYTVTVSATNSDNESQSWGTIFQLNILQ